MRKRTSTVPGERWRRFANTMDDLLVVLTFGVRAYARKYGNKRNIATHLPSIREIYEITVNLVFGFEKINSNNFLENINSQSLSAYNFAGRPTHCSTISPLLAPSTSPRLPNILTSTMAWFHNGYSSMCVTFGLSGNLISECGGHYILF